MEPFEPVRNILRQEGYDFGFDPSACAACGGGCCRGESGYIWVRRQEIAAIADFLELDWEDFGKMYLRKVGHRYSLNEREVGPGDFACVFLEIPNRHGVRSIRYAQDSAVRFLFGSSTDKTTMR